MARRAKTKRQQLLELARKSMIGRVTHAAREPGYGFYHGVRVARVALRIADRYDTENKIDRDELYAAGLFHDVSKGIEPHNETGAILLPFLLEPYFDKKAVTRIQRMIREHNQREPNARAGLGGKMLQDADALDHVGTQAVWLCFQYAARYNEPQAKTLAWYSGPKMRKKLKRWRDSLNFAVSKELFEQRVLFENDFFRQMRQEMTGEL